MRQAEPSRRPARAVVKLSNPKKIGFFRKYRRFACVWHKRCILVLTEAAWGCPATLSQISTTTFSLERKQGDVSADAQKRRCHPDR